jgi:hypothetical protein
VVLTGEMGRVGEETLKAIAKLGENLRHLELRGLRDIKDVAVAATVKKLCNLETLILR